MDSIRILGLSTTSMSKRYPRPSTSETLLEHALEYAKKKHSADTRLIRVRDLKIRPCEGYYSRALKACTWPCNITQQAAFIITGGQDGVQHVAGEMLMFWSELGFVFGRFPFVGWSRGWYAEDTEHNYRALKEWVPRYQNAVLRYGKRRGQRSRDGITSENQEPYAH